MIVAEFDRLVLEDRRALFDLLVLLDAGVDPDAALDLVDFAEDRS